MSSGPRVLCHWFIYSIWSISQRSPTFTKTIVAFWA
jgi:hypothetical protein